MRGTKRISAAEFAAIRPLVKIAEDRVEMARMVLVDGKTLREAGAAFEKSRQAAGQAVDVIWKTWQQYDLGQREACGAPLPAGWERVTLTAPASMIARFRAEAARAGSATPKRRSNKTREE